MSLLSGIHIRSKFVAYTEVIEKFTEEKIAGRYQCLLESADEFIKGMAYEDYVFCNENMLMYAVLGYFSDIMRLKNFTNIDDIHETKVLAYESEWLLKRKILQIKNSDDPKFTFCNEQFVFSQITRWLKRNDLDNDLGTNILAQKDLKYFTETLFYHLKYRSCDARTLELMLLAFTAGSDYQKLISAHS